jgi:hypothetical protein
MTAPAVAIAGYVWDTRAKQYRGPSGRFIPRTEIRRVLDVAIGERARRMQQLAQELRAGQLSGETWYVEMRQLVKDVHLYNAAAAKGGWAQLAEQDYGRVGRLVREQYRYLNRFAEQIGQGLPLDGRFLQRAQLYAEAGRRTFYALMGSVMRDKGLTEERNLLHVAEHCQDCIDQTVRGWVPIGSLMPVGTRDCLGRCKCSIDYR